MDQERASELIEKYLAGTCTEEEGMLVTLWFAKTSQEGHWEWGSEEERMAMAMEIQTQLPKSAALVKIGRWHRVDWQQIKWGAIAASFVALIGSIVWLSFFDRDLSGETKLANKSASYPLDDRMVTLELGDGLHVGLDSVSVGTTYFMGAFAVKKTGDRELVYIKSHMHHKSGQHEVNKLRVPKGKDYKLTLLDGTRIWVNTASVLEYSAMPKKGEHRMKLSGEAYFEVEQDHARSFTVKANHTEISVLGTNFNVNSYEKNRVVTTLATGKVKVANRGKALLLKPRQQATSYVDRSTEVNVVNVDQMIAWKNGYFVFNNQDIVSIMKDISRWYDVEVYYQGKVNRKRFGGTFSRTKNINDLLNYLESLSDLKFKQKGRRIIVMS